MYITKKNQNTTNRIKKMTNNNYDFGFSSKEFQGELNTIPYCQFLNGNNKVFGLAVIQNNAELAGFKPNSVWQKTDYEFNDGTYEKRIYICQQPRMLLINRSQPLMSNKSKTIPYDKEIYNKGGYKAFSYAVIWLLDENNKPLSKLPFRLKCSGLAGITFLKNYSYYNNPESFTKKFLQAYKTLTGDLSIDKNSVFYAHAVYQPNLVREKVTSSYNGQTSFAVQTTSFLKPTVENFASLIIKNGSPISNKIKEYIEGTKSWLYTTVEIEDDVEDSGKSSSIKELETDSVTPG